MKIKILFCLILVLNSLNLFAISYMGKIEPFKTYTISSEISGIVTFVNSTKEFRGINTKELIVSIDSSDENIQIQSLTQSLENLKEILLIQKQNYENKFKVKQLSPYDKNNEKLTYLQTKQIFIETKQNIKTLKNQKRKKEFYVKNKYLGKIYKNQGELINIGDVLFKYYDFSKIKIILFIKPEDIKDITNKVVFIDNKKSEFSISKISKVRDKYRVSTFEIELTKNNIDQDNIEFGQVVKVEFR